MLSWNASCVIDDKNVANSELDALSFRFVPIKDDAASLDLISDGMIWLYYINLDSLMTCLSEDHTSLSYCL